MAESRQQRIDRITREQRAKGMSRAQAVSTAMAQSQKPAAKTTPPRKTGTPILDAARKRAGLGSNATLNAIQAKQKGFK